ncbi:MAG: cupin domain-containing protein [Chloroflexota bacterium]|nr:cupin domain-containing protein [Chloroflexota bacterium]
MSVTSDSATGLRVIRISERVPDTAPTPGMTREHAIAERGLLAGVVRTEPGMVSGWHHHGEHDTTIYVAQGTLRMESADGVSDARTGDFIHVPPRTIHRESNPGDAPNLAVFSRFGEGPVTVNVEEPIA